MQLKLIKTLSIDKIKPDPEQPRRTFDKEELEFLSKSIKSGFQINPILVDDDYQIIVGERRWRALKSLGVKELKEGEHFKIVKGLQEREKRRIQSDEDILHRPIDLEERDKFWYKIYKKHNFKTQRELAEFLNVSEKLVTDAFDRLELEKLTQRKFKVSPSVITETVTLPIKDRIQLLRTAEKKDIGKFKVREYVEAIKKYSDRPEIKSRLLKGKIEPEKAKTFGYGGEELLKLPFRLDHSKMVLSGKKTQTSRFRLNGIREGDTVQANIFEPDFAKLKIQKIENKKLSEFTEKDAEREGDYTLEEFKKIWESIHGKWEPEAEVNIVHFKVLKRS